jgi:hypothetical protein
MPFGSAVERHGPMGSNNRRGHRTDSRGYEQGWDVTQLDALKQAVEAGR